MYIINHITIENVNKTHDTTKELHILFCKIVNT